MGEHYDPVLQMHRQLHLFVAHISRPICLTLTVLQLGCISILFYCDGLLWLSGSVSVDNHFAGQAFLLLVESFQAFTHRNTELILQLLMRHLKGFVFLILWSEQISVTFGRQVVLDTPRKGDGGKVAGKISIGCGHNTYTRSTSLRQNVFIES